MTRQEKIEAIIEDVPNWDLETLIDFVQSVLMEDLDKASDSTIDNYYESTEENEQTSLCFCWNQW